MSIFMIAIYAICAVYMLLNFKSDIHMLQQNSYRISRYWRWLDKNMVTTWRLIDIVVLFMLFTSIVLFQFAVLVAGAVALAKTGVIATRKFKKPLVFTKRVWRIYTLTGALALAGYLAVVVFINPTADDRNLMALPLAVLFLTTVFSWAWVIAAVWLLVPVEKSISRKYINDAARILRSMPDLKVVGVTGSYGKTSTKHFLERILSEKYDVLMTPGSFNTTMGVVRTVREMMKPYTEVFICEMGAKQSGDVKEICDLVHPEIGIVTAVGPMHLDTFKSIENVQATKFELIDALPSDGLAVINNDFQWCANRSVSNVASVRYSTSPHNEATYRAVEISYDKLGCSFRVQGPEGFDLGLKTRLVGDCNISNLVAAVIVAIYLGVPKERIAYAVASIEPVEHRLSMKQTPGGVTIIDDAFNSNPTGSRMALDVLGRFTDGQRIIVTPGMVELGDSQEQLNYEFGKAMAPNVDIAIIVGRHNRDAIHRGAVDGGMAEGAVKDVASFNEAQALLSTLIKPGDTVLYENDLPDSFK